MGCMRCGKETEGKAVFCPECLAEMENYPVKPGTVIHIPHRKEQEVRKTPRKRELTMEEQLQSAHRLIQFLVVAVLGLLGALIFSCVLLFFAVSQNSSPPEETQPPMSRNYTITTPAEDG